ncbi:hypothetical protein CDAR_314041 [Caerostris darwini]|uniref:Uncharacterized protein n=1 Tax=Caerostris darwini TaxID=1538125 RepID=A0AAV4MYE7_9ARAC|nr:hypothetical protein CDAR_314041 [Caerostris darwini]
MEASRVSSIFTWKKPSLPPHHPPPERIPPPEKNIPLILPMKPDRTLPDPLPFPSFCCHPHSKRYASSVDLPSASYLPLHPPYSFQPLFPTLPRNTFDMSRRKIGIDFSPALPLAEKEEREGAIALIFRRP